MTAPVPPPRPASRAALIAAALEAFGAHGRHGVSTRAIAAAAGMPMSQITYHFGGKDGLYLACAEAIAGTLGAGMAPALAALDARFERLAQSGDAAVAARGVLLDLLDAVAATMLGHETEAFVRFMLREQAEPGEAFATIYGGVMGQVLARIAHLLAVIAGREPEDAAIRVTALGLIGQMLVFRVARAAVARFAGWGTLEPAQLTLIKGELRANADAICTRLIGARSAEPTAVEGEPQ